MPVCGLCADSFPNLVVIQGKQRNLSSRKYCLKCSPWGKHNTRKIAKPIKRVTDEEFRQAVASNTTIASILRSIGYSHQSTAYNRVRKRVAELNLDTSHWVGQASRKGKAPPNKIPLSEILVRNSTYTCTSSLKRRMIREGLLAYVCALCDISEWQGKTLSLQLDHINGVNNDHRRENIRLLCPNCHSQTPTWGSKNRLS